MTRYEELMAESEEKRKKKKVSRYDELMAESERKRKSQSAPTGIDLPATLKDERTEQPQSIMERIDADIKKNRLAEEERQAKIKKEREDQEKHISKYVPSTDVIDVMDSRVKATFGVDSTKYVQDKVPHVSDINRSAAPVDYTKESAEAKNRFIAESPTLGMTPLEKLEYNARKYNSLAVGDMLINKAGAGAVQFGADVADSVVAPLKGKGVNYPTAQTTKELWSVKQEPSALDNYIQSAKDTLKTFRSARKDYYLDGNTLQDKAESYTAKIDNKYADLTDNAVTRAMSDLAQSAGYMIPAQLANAIIPNAGTALLFVSGYSSGERQALQEGASPQDARNYALLNGLNQSAGEMLIGGALGKGRGLIDGLLKKAGLDLADMIQNPTLKATAQKIFSALGEGAEEIVQGGIDVLAQRVTYNPEAKADPKGLAYEGLLGAGMGALFGLADSKALTLPSVQPETQPVKQSFAERNASDLSRINNDLHDNLRTADDDIKLERLRQVKTDTERTGILAGASEQTIQTATRFATKGNLDIEFYRESGQNGTVIDGFTQNGKIFVNAASSKVTSQIITHELLHNLEQTKSYDSFKKYVSEKVDLKTNIAQLTDLYKRAGIELSASEIESEALAKYAEKLFESEDDIYNLVRTDRTLGQKILDWINSMITKLTGTDEEKYLLRAKELYGKALAEARSDTVRADAVMASVSADIKSDNFKKWFGDSKVISEDSAPKVMYHSTDAKDINVFQSGNSAGTIYFADTVANAKKAARGKKNIVEVYLSMSNPVNTESSPVPWYDAEDSLKVAEWKRQGYDGVYVADESGTSIAVFSPSQIKSATSNIGTYDPKNPDIRYSISKTEDDAYMTAVESGDTETAQRMVDEAAQKSGLTILDDSASTSYRVRRAPSPAKTVKAYKLFDTKKSKPGELFPLYVGADTAVPQGIWLDAIAGQAAPDSKTGRKKVKSKLGPLAYRPGWHAGDIPLATHIGVKDANGNIWARQDHEVWAEVEVAADTDYQPEADANGKKKDGSFSVALADIKHMPENGMYRYKTNSNMTGNWIISGSMKINRVLTETEVNGVLARQGIAPMPWKSGKLDLSTLGLSADEAKNKLKILDPVTYDDNGNIIPLSQRFNPKSSDIRYSVSKDADYFRKKANTAKALQGSTDDIESWIEPPKKSVRRYYEEMTEKHLDSELKELDERQPEPVNTAVLPSVKQKNPLELDNVKELLSESDGLPPITEETAQEYDFAKGMVGNDISYNRDISRNLDSAAGKNKTVRDKLRDLVEKPFYVAKKNYADEVSTRLNKLKLAMDRLGIKQGTKESAAVQWIGEGSRQDVDGKIISYTEDDLKRDFPKTYKKIITAERYCRELYNEYIGRINQSLEKVYPNAVENVTQEQIKYAAAETFYAAQADLLGEQIKSLDNTIAKKESELAKAKSESTKYVTLKTSINYNKKRIETKKRTLDKYKAISERSGVLARQLQQDIDTGDAFRNKRLMPRKDYYHHFNEIENGFGGLVNLISTPTDIDSMLAGASEFTKPKSKWAGFLQQRQKSKYTEDAVGGLIKYIPAAEYKIALDPVIAEGRAHIQGIANATKDTRNANRFLTWYTDFINALAGKTNPFDRVVQKVASRKSLAVLRFINSRAKKNAIFGNFRSAVAQIFNLPNAAGLIKNPIDWAAGGKLYTENLIGRPDATALLDSSGFLTERYLDSAIRQFDESILKSPSKLFAWMLEVGDKQSTKLIWSSAYNYAVRKKKADPVLYADNIARRAVAGRGIGEVPLAQQAVITQFIAPFQIEVNNAWQLLKDKWRDKDIYGIFAIFLMSWLMNSLVRELFGFDVSYDPINAAHESIKEWDSKDTTYNNVMNVVGRQAGELISNIPFGSTVSDFVIPDENQRTKLFGDNDPTRFGTGNIGLNMFVDPIIEMVNGGDYTDELLSGVLNLALPYGGKQTEKIIKGLQDVGIAPRVSDIIGDNKAPKIETKAGSYSASGGLRLPGPDNPVEIAKTLALGSLSTKTGQEYIESDSRPLSAKNTEVYEKVTSAGANGLFANKVIREIQSKDKSEDKRSILMSSPLSSDHKLLLYREMLVQDEWNEAKLIDELTGISSSKQVLDIVTKYKDMNASKIKAIEKALEWQYWVDSQNYTDKQKGVIDEYINFRVSLPVEPTMYEKFTTIGINTTSAYKISSALSELTPLSGKTTVSNNQKYTAIADANVSEAEKMTALSVLMPETAYKALRKAYKAGIALKDYTKYLSDTSRIVSDQKNGKTVSNSYRQKVLTYIYSMRNLTKFQKDALYYLAGYSSKTIGDSPWRNGRVYAGDIYKVKKNGKVYDK